MKKLIGLSFAVTMVIAAPVMAHVGPDAIDHHLVEHLLIALAIGLPFVYGLSRLLKRSGEPRR